MSSFADFLFNGNPPPAVTTDTTSTTSLPPWYQAYYQGLIAKANQVAGEPYTPYGGPRVASFNPTQTQAFDLASSNVGNWQPNVNNAGSSITGGAGTGSSMVQNGVSQGTNLINQGTTYDPSQLNEFMSPYTSGVVNEIQRLGNQNLKENILPGVMDTFTGAGQFGSTRNQDFAARAIRDNDYSILGLQSQALQSGFNNAQNAYSTLRGQQVQGGTDIGNLGVAGGTDVANIGINAGQALGTLGQLQQQLTGKDVSTLDTLGTQQQNQTQQNLDTAYSDFLEQRNWPKTTTDWLRGVVQGLPSPGQTQTQTQTAPYSGSSMTPSPLAILSGLYSLSQSGSNGSSSGFPFRRGGRVPGYRSCGRIERRPVAIRVKAASPLQSYRLNA